MLTAEENERLTRVGAGTPMGELFRRYWLPALLSHELPAPDCPPMRVRLLGEDLVAFRDTNGRIGLLAEHCSHRRASLFYGRSEESGLRCIYHGWKYDVEGRILDTPAEPAASMLKHHIRQPAYPCQEVNGLVLTYMGPPDKMPLLPNYEWLTLPGEHVIVDSKFYNECNWLQALEGDLDSSHLPILHRRGEGLAPPMPLSVTFETQITRWGVKAACVRPASEGCRYIRTNVFVMPCIGLPPIVPSVQGVNDGAHAIYQVPADDYNVWRYDIVARRSVRIADVEAHYAGPAAVREDPGRRRYNYMDEVGPGSRKIANRANDYLIDRDKQRTSIYSGINFSNHTQDACVTESMGPITDRTEEHLGVGDTQLVEIRRFLLDALRDIDEGRDPPGTVIDPEDNVYPDLFMVDATLPLSAPWTDRESVMAHAGPTPGD